MTTTSEYRKLAQQAEKELGATPMRAILTHTWSGLSAGAGDRVFGREILDESGSRRRYTIDSWNPPHPEHGIDGLVVCRDDDGLLSAHPVTRVGLSWRWVAG